MRNDLNTSPLHDQTTQTSTVPLLFAQSLERLVDTWSLFPYRVRAIRRALCDPTFQMHYLYTTGAAL